MIRHNVIVSISDENTKYEEVEEYAKDLEIFLNDLKNVTHPDYYEAQDHLSRCYDYLTANEAKKIKEDSKNPPRSFTRELAVSPDELEARVKDLTYENYTDDQLEGILLFLSREVNCSSYELRKYYEAVKAAEDREEFVNSTKAELQTLIKLENSKLDIREFLPYNLANETLAFANNLKVSPEACLTTLITALSVCNRIGTVLEIRPAQGFVVSPYLFSMIVAESGSMKSPILRTFAKNSIEKIQRKFIENYLVQYAEWEEKISEWDATDKEDRIHIFPEGKPQIPDRPRLNYIGDKSIEGMNNQFDRYPDQAILYMKDEIAGLFRDADKYKSGKGSENTDLMSMFDGTAPPVIRAKEGLVAFPSTVGLSIFGTIQPEVLEEFWSSVIDPDGYWSRFLYCYQAKSLKELPMKRGGVESLLPEMLDELFNRVNSLPAVAYKLDDQGYETYRTFYDHLARKSYVEVHPAIAKAYSKALGLTGRLILNLHIINQSLDSSIQFPSEIVPLDTIVKGIKLMQFYLNQRLLLMNRLCNQDSISPQLKLIIELSERLGWITAREVKRNIWSLKNTEPSKIRSWFQEIVNLGQGSVEGKGNRVKYNAKI